MDRDTFIIVVYCLVVEEYQKLMQQICLRQSGFDPALTDPEALTMEICGEYFKLRTDQDLYDYFSSHYRHFFPALGDRTTFVRQCANLWQVKAVIQHQLTQDSRQFFDRVQPIDTLPLPVCGLTRAGRDHCFEGQADYGYCAAKDMHYYGFKLGLRISQIGMITYYPLFPARPHDVTLLEALVENFSGLIPADKGFIDEFRRHLLKNRYDITVVTPKRARMKDIFPPNLVKACSRIRKVIETVGSHLTERFGINHIRVHDLWHYQNRVIRKILAHTVCVFLNLQFHRQPLDLDGLVSA